MSIGEQRETVEQQEYKLVMCSYSTEMASKLA